MAQVLMKAVLLRGYGDVSQLSYEDVPEPLAAAGEVLVKTPAQQNLWAVSGSGSRPSV